MKESRPFFGRVESLRGIGCLFVAGYHISGWSVHGRYLLPHEPWSDAGPVQNAVGRLALMLLPGHAALMMFFAISGLVLFVSLQYGPQSLLPAARRFFIARAFRIFPIVIFGTIFAIGVLRWRSAGNEPPVFGAAEIVANMLLLQASINSTLWALQVEVLMAPVILLLYFVHLRYGPRALLAVGIVTTALAFSGRWALWPPLSNNLFAFVLGMLIPTMGRDWARSLSRRSAGRALLAAILVLFAAGPVFGFYSRPAAIFEAYAALVLLSIAGYRSDLGALAWLDHWLPRRLGSSSGSYYVLHSFLLWFPVTAASVLVPAAWSSQVPALVGIAVIVVSLAVIAPVCFVTYQLVEATGIAAGRRVLEARRPLVATE